MARFKNSLILVILICSLPDLRQVVQRLVQRGDVQLILFDQPRSNILVIGLQYLVPLEHERDDGEGIVVLELSRWNHQNHLLPEKGYPKKTAAYKSPLPCGGIAPANSFVMWFQAGKA